MDERSVLLCAAPTVAAAIQNARSQTLAAVARLRAETVEQRLVDARQLIEATRAMIQRGDRIQLDRQLSRIDALLSGEVAPKKFVRLPQQRDTDPALNALSARHIR